MPGSSCPGCTYAFAPRWWCSCVKGDSILHRETEGGELKHEQREPRKAMQPLSPAPWSPVYLPLHVLSAVFPSLSCGPPLLGSPYCHITPGPRSPPPVCLTHPGRYHLPLVPTSEPLGPLHLLTPSPWSFLESPLQIPPAWASVQWSNVVHIVLCPSCLPSLTLATWLLWAEPGITLCPFQTYYHPILSSPHTWPPGWCSPPHPWLTEGGPSLSPCPGP